MTTGRVLRLAAFMAVSSQAVGCKSSKRARAEGAGKNTGAQDTRKTSDDNSDLEKCFGTLISSGFVPRELALTTRHLRIAWHSGESFGLINSSKYPNNGQVRTKTQMIAAQSGRNFAPAEPYPSDFKLMAVYKNFAVAIDHTLLKMRDSNGKAVSTTDTRVLRMFVKESGHWRPAGAALVPVVP